MSVTGEAACGASRSPAHSALLVRLGSRRPSSQMPPLGTVVKDEIGFELVREWIAQLAAPRATVASGR